MKKFLGLLMMVFAMGMIMGCDNETTNDPPATQNEQLVVTALNNWFNASGIQISLNSGAAQVPDANMRNAFTAWLNANNWTSVYSTQKNTPANFENLFIRWANEQSGLEVVGINFNEDAFREWANNPARSLSLVGGAQPVPFSDQFINNATAFARDNWNSNEYRNNAATFNRLTVKFADSIWPGNRPVITKRREFACTKNVLGEYMRGTIVYG